LDEGLATARAILASAKRPLLDGLAYTTVEAQRLGILLAEKYGGVVIGHASRLAARLHRAGQARGFVTSTLGELRHRADMIILWNADPAVTHPRHFDRYSLYPEGRFVPRGRQDRTLVWVGSVPSSARDLADYVVPLAPGRDFEAATVLLALQHGIDLDADEVARQTGVSLETWIELHAMVARARYGALLHDAAAAPESAEADARVLMQWTQKLNEKTSFVYHSLVDGANGAGLEQVIGWLTGRAGVIDFGSGRPRVCVEAESAEDLLLKRSVDAALFLSRDPLDDGSPTGWRWLGFIPTIVLSPEATSTSTSASVWFRTAPFGKSVAGTVFRADGVSLPILPIWTSPLPSDEVILRRLLETEA
jgi:formylmethanofuran dehydrogenase subunit B